MPDCHMALNRLKEQCFVESAFSGTTDINYTEWYSVERTSAEAADSAQFVLLKKQGVTNISSNVKYGGAPPYRNGNSNPP